MLSTEWVPDFLFGRVWPNGLSRSARAGPDTGVKGLSVDRLQGQEADAGGVDILSKAAALCFALESDGELTAQQLAERVAEPASSTFRLLAQLIQLGWVERGIQRSSYRLGLTFMTIGGRVEDRIDIRVAAQPSLASLTTHTGAASYLSVRRAQVSVCIERVEGGDVGSFATRIGDSLPLHSGAASMAILAHLPRSEQHSYLEHVAGTGGRATVEVIERELQQVRDRGYSISDATITPGVGAIGAPVYNHRGELEASISVSGLRNEVLGDTERTGKLVREAAWDTGLRLGAEVPK